MKGKICFSEPTKGNEQNKQGDFSSQIIFLFIRSISKAHSTVRYLSLSKCSVNSSDFS